MIRLSTVLATLALASCMENEPAMKDCQRQFTETECACLREAIPEEKWRALEDAARNPGKFGGGWVDGASWFRVNAEGKCGPLEPRVDASVS